MLNSLVTLLTNTPDNVVNQFIDNKITDSEFTDFLQQFLSVLPAEQSEMSLPTQTNQSLPEQLPLDTPTDIHTGSPVELFTHKQENAQENWHLQSQASMQIDPEMDMQTVQIDNETGGGQLAVSVPVQLPVEHVKAFSLAQRPLDLMTQALPSGELRDKLLNLIDSKLPEMDLDHKIIERFVSLNADLKNVGDHKVPMQEFEQLTDKPIMSLASEQISEEIDELLNMYFYENDGKKIQTGLPVALDKDNFINQKIHLAQIKSDLIAFSGDAPNKLFNQENSLKFNGIVSQELMVSNPVQDDGWGNEVAEKLVMMSNKNMQSAQIQLDPPELGPLNIRIVTINDKVSVYFASQHEAVREALESAMPQLKEILENSGINLDKFNLSDKNSKQQEQNFLTEHNEKQQLAQGTDSDNDEQVNFIAHKINGLIDYFV